MRLGPDAARYWFAGGGGTVSRPFHLRWLLPAICGQHLGRWWTAWFAGWVLVAGGMAGWRFAAGDDWRIVVAATVLLVALPGILGPVVVIPVGVDLPATGLTLCGVALIEHGGTVAICAGVAMVAVAASIKESAPAWAALWLWSLWPIIALGAVAVAAVVRRPGPDPLGVKFQHISDHPFRASLDAHRGRWRDGWLMVAPWGVCLAALHDLDWRLVVVLAVAYAQLAVATDTVRLYSHAAGPVMAAAAAATVPAVWLPLAVVAHVWWWRKPERV